MNRPRRTERRRRLRDTRMRDGADHAGFQSRPPTAPIQVLFVARLRRFRDSVAYFTRLLGYSVRTADSVASALIVLRRAPVDIVVVEEEQDVLLLLTTLQTQSRVDILVIVIALVLTTEDSTRWIQMGAFSCVPKPFDLRTYRYALAHAATALRARRGETTM